MPQGKGFFLPGSHCLLGLEGLREVDGLEVLAFSSVSLVEALGSKLGVSSMALDMDRVMGTRNMTQLVLALSLEPLGADCHYAHIKLK